MESKQRGFPGSDARSSALRIWVPPCCIAALILLISSTPGAYYPEHPDFLNNIVHFMEFGLLGLLLARALYKGLIVSKMNLFLWTTAICVMFGLLDELHQFLVPARVFDLMDLVFDSLGAAAGSGVFIFYSSLKGAGSAAEAAPIGDMDD